MLEEKQAENIKNNNDGCVVWSVRIILISMFSFVASCPFWFVYYLFSLIIRVNGEKGWCCSYKIYYIIYFTIYFILLYLLVLRKREKQ